MINRKSSKQNHASLYGTLQHFDFFLILNVFLIKCFNALTLTALMYK